MIVELLFAERNHVCAVCVSNGHCELQALAQTLGMTHVRVPYRYPRLTTWTPRTTAFVVDHNRCILCTRCVRVCDEIEGAHTWDVHGPRRRRPGHHRPEPAVGRARRRCTGCGKCVQVCPTGALFEKGKSVARDDEATRSSCRT